ncbi:hypothetical protein [Parasitella parasitica]|uniref:Protein kinase domain-containing protein n=1 Tax=Parasitella parasitica TaxID=35722 RepID=A0A0B7MX03_9FUNG|nr:hypothetical protein [Parasitella parasitica]
MELFDMDVLKESEDIYLILGCMDASLHDVIFSKQPLDTVHSQKFLLQLLFANILVNKDCDIRICDLGMGRSFAQTDSSSFLTEYVTTRWYRSPEIMVSGQNYNPIEESSVPPTTTPEQYSFENYHLPSATMSLLKQHTPDISTTTTSMGDAMYPQDPLMSEPEELGEDDNYSYLRELIKNTVGVSADPERQIREPLHGEAHQTSERALSGF